MEKSSKPSAEELLRKILELEQRQAHLKQEISKLMLSDYNHRPKPNHQRAGDSAVFEVGVASSVLAPVSSSLWPVIRGTHDGVHNPLAMKLNDTQYWNIVQSMGQAMHIFDFNGRIFFWVDGIFNSTTFPLAFCQNRASENLYGFTSEEAYGKTPTELLVEAKDAVLSDYLLMRIINGESWSGKFPIRKKSGEVFVVIATNTPYRDENGRIIGGLCVLSDAQPYQVMKQRLTSMNIASTSLELASQQPLQTSIASKILNFASKVKMKLKKGDEYKDDEDGSDVISSDHTEESSLTPRGHIAPSPFAVFHSTCTEEEHLTIGSESENELIGIHKILSSKAEAWMEKRGIAWPWKEREVEFLDARIGCFGWHRLDTNQQHEHGLQISSCAFAKLDCQLWEDTHLLSNKMDASGFWFSSLHVSSTNSTSSGKSNVIIEMEREINYEILWDDLITKEQIGQGSCGTVCRGLWYGSVYVSHLSHLIIDL